jgi:hypothetical protein
VELSFYPLALEALDQADAEALCLFVTADERPLGGLAGLTDWRLAGRLSAMIRAGILTGAAGEALLTPPGARLSFRKLFLFGLGSSAADGDLQPRLSEALRRLAYAGVHDVALQLPVRIALESGVRALVEEPQAPARALLFAPEPAKLIAALSQTPMGSHAQIERRVVKVPSPPKASPPPRSMQRTPTPPEIAKPVMFVPEEVPAPPERTGRRPAPPPPQRYHPPEPKPSTKKKR